MKRTNIINKPFTWISHMLDSNLSTPSLGEGANRCPHIWTRFVKACIVCQQKYHITALYKTLRQLHLCQNVHTKWYSVCTLHGKGSKMKTKEQVNNKTQCKPAPNTESKHSNTKWMATWTHCKANSSKSKRGGNHYIKDLHLLFGLY